MDSIWQNKVKKVNFSELNEDKKTDVLIVGGGIAGILCAYKLKKAGVDYILAESDEILSGITKNTTAKISVLHGLIYDKLIGRLGVEKAKLYAEAQIQAGKEYERLCKNIDCDYEKKDSCVYSLTDIKEIENEIKALQALGLEAEFSLAEELPIKVAGAVRKKDEAAFHPVKFLYSIARDLNIYEHTKVKHFTKDTAVCEKATIRFQKLIVATHFPVLNKHGLYPLKLYQHRSYVIALKNAQKLDGMYVDKSDTGMSFRSYGDLLLLGGGGHRTGKSGGCWQELEDFAKRHYKDAEIISKWATQDCMTLDGIPYIGQYSKTTPNVFAATGFNKWGMTNAMAASDILCDLVIGKRNKYSEVFSPSRSILHPKLFTNILESTVGLITPSAPRCPHLGCALKYNRAEHSWDCPCHGSRFTESGELIDNPATDDKKFKN